jgi:hypothetical protein
MERHSTYLVGAIRSTILVFACYLLSLGLFVAKAEAAEKVIELECSAGRNVDVTVSPDVDYLTYKLSSDCLCLEDAEKLKSSVLSGQIASDAPGGGSIALRPGQTYELKLYCYTRSMLNPGSAR